MVVVNLILQRKKQETQRGCMARIRSGIQSQVCLIPKTNAFYFIKLHIDLPDHHHSVTLTVFLNITQSQNLALPTAILLFPSLEEHFLIDVVVSDKVL